MKLPFFNKHNNQRNAFKKYMKTDFSRVIIIDEFKAILT